MTSDVPSHTSAPLSGDHVGIDGELVAAVLQRIDGALADHNTKISSCLDTFLFHQEQATAKMRLQQKKLDDAIARLDRKGAARTVSAGSREGSQLPRGSADKQSDPSGRPQVSLALPDSDSDKSSVSDRSCSSCASESEAPLSSSMLRPAPRSILKNFSKQSLASKIGKNSERPSVDTAAGKGNSEISKCVTDSATSSFPGPKRKIPSHWLAYTPMTRALHDINESSQPLMVMTSLPDGVAMLKAIERTIAFEAMCVVMILANVILVTVETVYMSENVTEHADLFWSLQLAVNCWFTIELLLRFGGEGPAFFVGVNWRWNMFDSLILLTSAVDMLVSNTSAVSGGALKAIRLMRVVRSVRMVKALKYVREFRKMVFSLQSSAQTGFWSLFLLVCFMYLFAIIFTQATAEYLQGLPDEELLSDDHVRVAELYGTLTRSFYSLYTSITNGAEWGVCFDPLMRVGTFHGILFVIYVSTSIFCVTNVITAVFVESAMTSAQYYKDLIMEDSRRNKEIAVQHMRKIFATMCDNTIDNEQVIGVTAFEELLKDPQLQVYMESLDLTAQDTRVLFELLDIDSNGDVSLEEFCHGCLRLKGDAKSFDVHVLMGQVARLQNAVAPLETACIALVGMVEELNTRQESMLKEIKRRMSKVARAQRRSRRDKVSERGQLLPVDRGGGSCLV